jgi:N-sulfoglucosamine sulfohydrolase
MAGMTRREFAAVGAAPLLQLPKKRWNILWISCEDTSPTYGCYGDSYAVTPNLDRLATEGARYTNAFSVYPVCAPSRSSIITGMYPATIGSHHMRSLAVPPPEVKCFPEYLRAAGYYCSNNAKTDYNFNGASAAPLSAWDESSGKAHWRNRDKDQPFFSVFNLLTTHESQYRDPSPLTQKLVAALPQKHDPAKAPVPPYYPDTPVVRRDIANYYDTVTAMDGQVAALLKQLDDDGLRDNTVVFHWGDHGWGMPRGKRWLYDSGTKVPLIVRWPGTIPAGSTPDDLVSLFDLGPTALSIAGVPIPKHMQAQAFLGDQKAKPRDYCFMARDRMDETYDMMRSVRDKRFRYTKNYFPGRPYAQFIQYMEEMPTMKEMRTANKAAMLNGPQGEGKPLTPAQAKFFAPEKPKEELYDSIADPHEVNNLADDPKFKPQLERMRAAHEQFMKQTKDLGEVPEAELVERMRPGGKWQKTEPPVLKRDGKLISATCPTAGASIIYEMRGRWLLYSKPVELESSSLAFRACRLGYRDSDVVREVN